MAASPTYLHAAPVVQVGCSSSRALPNHRARREIAYKLLLPRSMKIHPVFHVILLELHVANTFPGRVMPPPLPTEVDGLPEFVVNKILDSKFWHRKLYYLEDWVGYNDSEHSWEPVVNLAHATFAVREFHARCPDRLRPIYILSDSSFYYDFHYFFYFLFVFVPVVSFTPFLGGGTVRTTPYRH